ncbi:hypothetical protein FWK35_00012175, partial [Aphis craccivora]
IYLGSQSAFYYPRVEVVRCSFVLDGQTLSHYELGIVWKSELFNRQRIEVDTGRITYMQ